MFIQMIKYCPDQPGTYHIRQHDQPVFSCFVYISVASWQAED